MLEYGIALAAGSAVFLIFMLVFLRKDNRGKRGGRLAGCSHRGSEGRCDRCREDAPVTIQAQPTEADRRSTRVP